MIMNSEGLLAYLQQVLWRRAVAPLGRETSRSEQDREPRFAISRSGRARLWPRVPKEEVRSEADAKLRADIDAANKAKLDALEAVRRAREAEDMAAACQAEVDKYKEK